LLLCAKAGNGGYFLDYKTTYLERQQQRQARHWWQMLEVKNSVPGQVAAPPRQEFVAALKTLKLCNWKGSSSAKSGIGGGF
jgi:hypothetical protein